MKKLPKILFDSVQRLYKNNESIIRVIITMLIIFLLFKIEIPSIDNNKQIETYANTQNDLVNVFIAILTMILYVLTLYTVLTIEENDLLNRKDKLLELHKSCTQINQLAKEVLENINKTLEDISKTWIRWAIYELPYAYTITFSIVATIHLFYRELNITWEKVLFTFTIVLVISGIALLYTFRRSYEKKYLQLNLHTQECIKHAEIYKNN